MPTCSGSLRRPPRGAPRYPRCPGLTTSRAACYPQSHMVTPGWMSTAPASAMASRTPRRPARLGRKVVLRALDEQFRRFSGPSEISASKRSLAGPPLGLRPGGLRADVGSRQPAPVRLGWPTRAPVNCGPCTVTVTGTAAVDMTRTRFCDSAGLHALLGGIGAPGLKAARSGSSSPVRPSAGPWHHDRRPGDSRLRPPG